MTFSVNVIHCIFRPLPNKTKMKFDQDFKACWSHSESESLGYCWAKSEGAAPKGVIAPILRNGWSYCFELKVLNESKYSMAWVHYAFGNVLSVKRLTYDTLQMQDRHFPGTSGWKL